MKVKNLVTLIICGLSMQGASAQEKKLIDNKATLETKNLYKNLDKLLKKGVMFGHQDDLAYGVEWKTPDGKKSDVYDVVNDYPAIFGWDIGHIEHKSKTNLDRVPFKKMKEYIKQVYDMGGINTISWHVDNPVTMGNSWDNTTSVSKVLPGGSHYKQYRKWLKNAAKYLKRLKGSDGKKIPIVFRPYHELNGGWFWWGKDSTTTKEYVELFRYTVDYLKNKKKVHNLIYVFNTNTFGTAEEFMERYPGDDVVDMVSFDSYQFAKPTDPDSLLKKSSLKFQTQLRKSLTVLDSVAKKHNKIPTFAETGFETIPQKDWWTSTLLEVVKDFEISYVLVWRNHGWQTKENKFHYYGPYLNHPSSSDFKKFYDSKNTLFQSDIAKENVYK